MSDRIILQKIKKLINNNHFSFKMEKDVCKELILTSPQNTFYGTIRHLNFNIKQEILNLISRLESLEVLDLSRNSLGYIPECLFNLKKLKVLNILSNNLQAVSDSINKLNNLEYLNMGSNELVSLPLMNSLFNLKKFLIFKNIKIKNFENIKELINLEEINLYFISTNTLPEYFFNFKKLKTLTLWNTNIFNKSLDCYEHLEYFTNCGCRALETFPSGLCDIKSLKMIRLYQNQIKTIPINIYNLTHLEQLSLYQNNLKRIPKEILKLTKLTKLNLGWNKIDKVPLFLKDMKNLKWVGLFQNPCSSKAELYDIKKFITTRPFSNI